MRKAWTLFALTALAGAAGIFFSAQSADASFHIMRVYGVMGGANGNADIQYVELRMPDTGQNFLLSGSGGTAVLCFFDAAGAPFARFKFSADVANGADEASILVGTSEFDSAWAAGSLDPSLTFSAANTVALPGGGSELHPVRSPDGKVAFGTDGATSPANMCGGGMMPSLSVIDSVAYGTGYTGTANFGTKFNTDLPTSGIQNFKVQGPAPTMPLNGSLCFPGSFLSSCSVALNNSMDYSLVSTNSAGNQPRNNSNTSGPVAIIDADGDGIPDLTDLCPGTAPAAPRDDNGCSQAQVDGDADGACDPGAPSGGPGPCTPTDNCPTTSNPGQGDVDGDTLGDACDPDADDDGFDNVSENGSPLCSDMVNDDSADDVLVNDGCPAVGASESACAGGADDDLDSFPNDGCPMSGTYSEDQFNIGTNSLGPCDMGMTEPSPSWPLDFVSTGGSDDKVTLTDLTSFLAPARRLDTSPGDANFDQRWDLQPGKGAYLTFIALIDLTSLLAGTTGVPPMLGGVRAFGGPTCTGP